MMPRGRSLDVAVVLAGAAVGWGAYLIAEACWKAAKAEQERWALVGQQLDKIARRPCVSPDVDAAIAELVRNIVENAPDAIELDEARRAHPTNGARKLRKSGRRLDGPLGPVRE